MFPTSWRPVAAATLAALMLTGCATLNVNSYAMRGADFRQYQTYAWGPADTFSTGDPRLDNNTFFNERVQKDIDAQLAARGFEKRESGAPDLVLHYHANISQEIDVAALDRPFGYVEASETRPDVYDAGTLTIDFVDPRTNRVVWRGWAEGSIEGVIEDQALMEERIDTAVMRILARFPRAL